MEKLFITGGCGYVGSLMIQNFLDKYIIKNVDTQWFGNKLKEDKNLTNIKVDIRNLSGDFIDKNTYAVIHLANIANDPSVELDQTLSWEVNVLAAKKLIEESIKEGVKKFVYASSGSVYDGYMNSFPQENAKILSSRNIYDFTKISNDLMASTFQIPTVGLRFGTLSGYSPIMREDLIINKMTKDALDYKIITVSNASAFRSCLGMQDLCNAIMTLINQRSKILELTAVFNLASFSKSIEQISGEIAKKMGAERKYIGDSPTYNFSMSVEKFERIFNFQFVDTIEKIVDGLIHNISN